MEERADLMRRWYDEISCDRKWLNLGGCPEKSVDELMEDYGLEAWLEFEYWDGLADTYWASWDLDEDEDTEGDDTQDENTQGEDTQDEDVEDEENEGESEREGEEDGGEEPLEWYSPNR